MVLSTSKKGKVMKKFFAILPFIIIAASTYFTLTGSWITPGINRWQAKIMGDNKFYPALTIFILALPPLLLLLAIKLLTNNSSSKRY
jgi:hypothetical protein